MTHKALAASESVGVFLDAYNIAINTRGTLNRALDYGKLRRFTAKQYGHVNLALAYFDRIPVPPALAERLGDPSLATLVERMKAGSWGVYDLRADIEDAMPRDIKVTAHMFDSIVLYSGDLRIQQQARRVGKPVIALGTDRLIEFLPALSKDDPHLEESDNAIEKGQWEIAAALLSIRLEKALKQIATKAGLLRPKAAMSSVAGSLRNMGLLTREEIKKIDHYRERIRNVAAHGDEPTYTTADVVEFRHWLFDWLESRDELQS